MTHSQPKMTLEALIEEFRTVGAADAEGWARSQMEEGIPQLARFAFLKAAWNHVVAEHDASWIESELRYFQQDPGGIGAAAGRALERLLNLGATAEDLTDLVRVMQWRTLDGICNVIDKTAPYYRNPWNEEEHWHLVLCHECPPTELDVGGLHESVLETDPTGREMQPRSENSA